MILAKLKRDTRDLHERVEHALDLLGRSPSATEYRNLLRRFYGYYVPVEDRLAGLPWDALGFDWAARRKASLIESDLLALGDGPVEREATPRCSAIPELGTLPLAFGCLYVLEGSTLGGRVITRHLSAVPGDPLPTAFFGSYGEKVGTMWMAFGAFLTGYAADRDDDEAIVGSARATFATLGAWLMEGAW